MTRLTKNGWKRFIALVLCVGMLFQNVPTYAAEADEPPEAGKTAGISDYGVNEAQSGEESAAEKKTGGEASLGQLEKAGQSADTNDAQGENAVDVSALYEDGYIKIYNLAQLNKVGSGDPVCFGDSEGDTVGTGDAVTDGQNQITYSSDAKYRLMNEIGLDVNNIWNLPEGFSGSFGGGEISKDSPLYDKSTDTIYIYNSYQLDIIAQDNSAEEPVMSNDMIAEEFGVGQFVYADGEPADDSERAAQDYLTYSKDHNYVLATAFTAERPEMKAQMLVEGDDEEGIDGREYKGQVIYYDENGEEYILIGNKQQLQAIGKMDEDGNPYKVTEPVWAQKQEYHVLGVYWEDIGDPYQVYPGDADLSENDTLYGAPDADENRYPGVGKHTDALLVAGSTRELHIGSKKLTDSSGKTVYTYDKTATEFNTNMERKDGNDVVNIYSTWANYIIFRDIDLENEEWNPLMFSGKMEGRLSMQSGSNITIRNISVTPVTTKDSILGIPSGDEKLDTGSNIGIGFFGTITNPSNAENIGLSGGTAVVKNINLDEINVQNDMTDVADVETVVSGLTKVLGGLLGAVGGLLDGILGGLGGILGGIFGSDKPILGDLKLGDLLGKLLTVRGASADTFATGGFAGRIIGDVEVSGCHVTNLTIFNVMDMTGGFVGNVEGLTEYEGLGTLLKGTTDTLSGILNLIPGLGLGDLITVLLNNPELLNINELLPTGYIQADITDCSVSVKNVENVSTKKFAGGFAGVQTGANLSGCNVNGIQSVSAEKYAGGFAGLTRDAVIKGLLENLDVEIVNIATSSTTNNCQVQGNSLNVMSNTDYSGGFTGAVANSKVSNSSVGGLSQVRSAGNYAAGFAGRTTIGYGPALAEADEADTGLLGTVADLLKEVLSGEKGDAILNLIGIKPAEMTGCQVSGSGVTVQAQNYAGGLFGQGDGTIMTGTSQNKAEGLAEISAGENYAGGLAGQIGAASAVGVIDNTLGVGKMLEFEASNAVISGIQADESNQTGFKVTAAGEYAGGACGQAVGGTLSQVTVKNLYQVNAVNYAGGFAGSAGTGSLVDGGGLNLLGLGLIKIEDLLSVAEAVVLDIADSSVSGDSRTGYSVTATGTNSTGGMTEFLAGGFVGESGSAQISDSIVSELLKVSADQKDGSAGGFVGSSFVGGLANVTAEPEEGLANLISLENLLKAAGYLIPKYTKCSVAYKQTDTDAVQIQAAVAGGFVGRMTGGVIDNTGLGEEVTTLAGIQNVEGNYYAGGFAGYVVSGGLAEAGGLSLLSGLISTGGLDNLLGVLEVYIPEIHSASVKAGDLGLIVKANRSEGSDTTIGAAAGSAGGYAGYVSGVYICNSDLDGLRSTKVKEPDTLDAENGDTYFGTDSSYAVTAPKYAGGYAGKIDIGNAASVGGGLSLLGTTIGVSDLTSALSVVASRINGCDVSGKVGGFSVLASEETDGHAGGYAGQVSGAWINNSNTHNFAYIIGQNSAGGYAGTIEPGNVSSVIGNASVLGKFITIDNNFLSLVQAFVPVINNSSTDSVPCGGVVRAEIGNAGGYAGHSLGGQIHGKVEDNDTSDSEFVMTPCEAAVYRIRSVYGRDYAGGFTGLMETASVAETGSIKLIGDLISIDNPLTAVQGIYPTETNTGVYGPLSHVDYQDWNDWVTHVGSKGPYGNTFAGQNGFQSQDEFDQFIEDYVYGYSVTAPGKQAGSGERENGSAGGYVGKMLGGVITDGNAHDLQKITAWRSAGGYVGEMMPGSLASTGSIDLAGIEVANNNAVNVLETFLPVISISDVSGYGSGYTVTATGFNDSDKAYEIGYAGGFVGRMTAGQIWGEADNKCSANGLRKVSGTQAVGGFAGMTEPGTTLTADTTSENGLLNQILGKLINTTELLDVLRGVIATVKYAEVSAWNEWGYVVNGSYTDGEANTKYADSAGGFVGRATGTVFGSLDDTAAGLSADNVRSVVAGENAGGFVGKTSVAGVAEVAGEDTSILGSVLSLKGIDILDIFRTYIYDSAVSGSGDSGLEVISNQGRKVTDTNNALVYEGNAGGFAGSLLSGDTYRCTVTGLRNVSGVNFTGGFTGYMGKTGLVDVDGVDVLDKLLQLGVGVADLIGCQSENCTVSGMEEGFTVQSKNHAKEKAQIAGGFAGYADLGRITGGKVENLKQVASGEIAGGFVGKTSHSYLAEVTIDGSLLNILTDVLNALLKQLLHLDQLEDTNLIHINLGILELDVLYEGNLASLTLLGIPITATLVQDRNVLKVTIGDSEIELGYDPETEEITETNELNGLRINLIKANRSKADSCVVTGIPDGYDVYGGGASNDADGTDENGYAGGFVGYNDSGLLENNDMYLADVVRGTKDKTGPFSGQSANESAYEPLNGVENVEENGNQYRIYREADSSYTAIYAESDKKNSNFSTETGSHIWNVYTIDHMTDSGVKYFTELESAVLRSESTGNADISLEAYQNGGAKAVLMLDTDTETTPPSDTPEPSDQQDPCDEFIRLTVNKIWKGDNAETRPNITVTIWQQKLDGVSEPIEYETITMSVADKESTNVWKQIIKELPVYEPAADGSKVYYKYTVTEAEVPGYETSIDYSEDGYTVTITNAVPWYDRLPGTGGMGTMLLYLLAAGLLTGTAISFVVSRRKRRRA